MISALEARLDTFAVEHRCSLAELARDAYAVPSGKSLPKELEILERFSLEQREFGRDVPAPERALIRVLKQGVREFVDTALDEMVGRGAPAGPGSKAADPGYIPALMRSQCENFVCDPDVVASTLRPPTPELAPRPDAAFGPIDFLRDCCGPHVREELRRAPPAWTRAATAVTLAMSASPPTEIVEHVDPAAGKSNQHERFSIV